MNILQILKLRVRQAEIRLARPSYHRDSRHAVIRLNGELAWLVKEQAAYIGALEAVLEEKEQAVTQ